MRLGADLARRETALSRARNLEMPTVCSETQRDKFQQTNNQLVVLLELIIVSFAAECWQQKEVVLISSEFFGAFTAYHWQNLDICFSRDGVTVAGLRALGKGRVGVIILKLLLDHLPPRGLVGFRS